MNKILILILVLLISSISYAQQNGSKINGTIQARGRVIIDNDFGGDPDGLFQLAHHLLSPSVEICGVISSHHYKEFYGYPGNVEYSFSQVKELLNIMNMSGKIPVYKGAPSSLRDLKVPIESEGSKAIIKEAMRKDTKTPLYIVCGAGLTNIASAFLMKPEITDKIILIWIGGPEYEGLSMVPPQSHREYNLGIDIKATQVIYNVSNISIWQIPRDTYRQALFSFSELTYRIKPVGKLGCFLMEKLEDLMKRADWNLGEAYVLGDSPLVLVTALQSSWEVAPSSSRYITRNTPKINDAGFYDGNQKGRPIRIFTNLDIRLMFEDMVAKLILFEKNMR